MQGTATDTHVLHVQAGSIDIHGFQILSKNDFLSSLEYFILLFTILCFESFSCYWNETFKNLWKLHWHWWQDEFHTVTWLAVVFGSCSLRAPFMPHSRVSKPSLIHSKASVAALSQVTAKSSICSDCGSADCGWSPQQTQHWLAWKLHGAQLLLFQFCCGGVEGHCPVSVCSVLISTASGQHSLVLCLLCPLTPCLITPCATGISTVKS